MFSQRGALQGPSLSLLPSKLFLRRRVTKASPPRRGNVKSAEQLFPSRRTHHAQQTGAEQQHRAGLWDRAGAALDDTCIIQAVGTTILLVNRKLDAINAILQIWGQL